MMEKMAALGFKKETIENSRLAAPKSEYALAHYQEFGLTAADMEGTILKFPTVTFKDAMRIDLGGKVMVDLSYPGASHTDGSITVLVSPDQVLFAGDILFTKYHNYLGEGDIPSWGKSSPAWKKPQPRSLSPDTARFPQLPILKIWKLISRFSIAKPKN